MSFFSFFLPQVKHDELAVVFDISSGSVQGALVLFSQDNLPQILFTHHVIIPLQKNIVKDLERYTTHLLKSLDECASFLEKKTRLHYMNTAHRTRSVTKSYLTFSSPWCASETKVFSKEYQKPIFISNASLKKLIDEEKKIFEEKIDEKRMIQTKIVEDKILRVKLNGYYVDIPEGKQATMIEIISFITIVERALYEKIESSILKHFPSATIKSHSFALAAFVVTRDLFPKETNFLYIHVDDEVTDVAVIRHEAIVEHISFPVGRNSIIRSLAKKFATTTGTAQSALTLHEKGVFEDNTRHEVETASEEVLTLWYDGLKALCMSLTQELQAPKTIFILVDDTENDVFYRTLKKEKNLYTIDTGDHLHIIPQNTNLFRKFLSEERPAEHDPALSISILFAEKVFKQ